ncbi:chloride channel protein [Novosphingobium sp. 9]|uniref:chloride channel protein n=1 Tax=Novosphingobium sp. 9 TaxID=2025349 RepID=UPI0021B5F7D4|nr:chloride channel protein [Novosphingobium sp. 9]
MSWVTRHVWIAKPVAFAVRQRRRVRQSEAAFIVLAVMVGLAAGWTTNLLRALAHGMQRVLYGVTVNRVSALGEIHHPWRLIALPIGGVLLVGLSLLLRRRRAPIDVVEANAMHGGRIPFTDNLVIAVQTLFSNGAGASVGLEAAYAQMGGGMGSWLGQWFNLRRADMRILVGAGAGAAIGAAFGAPITGAFYAFEIIIGTYAPAGLAPVMAASLSAVFISKILGAQPYLIATTAERIISLREYAAYAVLGLACAGVGIVVMRLVTFAEINVQGRLKLGRYRPLVGGVLLIPLALISPQVLSAGHGAMHLNLAMVPPLQFLLMILVLKMLACTISLSFGFRGGLFFASLFLGSITGQIFADLVEMLPLGISLDHTDAALVGMAAVSVSIVGGPMTLTMLMLETTHDFALMGLVLTASLISSAITRQVFGYSFSTWRLHLRGSVIRGPRDIGWMLKLSAGRIMRTDWSAIPGDMTLAQARERIRLGSTKKVIVTDEDGRYLGIAITAAVHDPAADEEASVASVARLEEVTLSPATGIRETLEAFDNAGADEIAVVDGVGRVLGIVTEAHARRRYFEEMETFQRELYGES